MESQVKLSHTTTKTGSFTKLDESNNITDPVETIIK